jgi:uncharacterized protein with NRDE domain
MCLAILAVDVLPDWPLIVVANRDEYHDRAAAPLQPWHQYPDLLAGQDLQAGGTWLGVTRGGRFSLLTNFRDPKQRRPQAPSRGQLVENFLKAELSADAYLRTVEPKADAYNGFNLIVADWKSLHYSGNQAKPFKQSLSPGVYGLSNALLDTPWPKTHRTRQAVAALLAEPFAPDAQRLAALMQDRTVVPDDLLPDTGMGLVRERLLATPFIVSPEYGTRCTTVVMRHRNGNQWVQETTHNAVGEMTGWVGWLNPQGGQWRCFDRWPGTANIASSAIA